MATELPIQLQMSLDNIRTLAATRFPRPSWLGRQQLLRWSLRRRTAPDLDTGQQGFTLLEIAIVITVGVILTAMAIPKINALVRGYRSVGDARSLAEEVSLAKMRAAADFTEARVFADLSSNQYRVETWNRASSCWITEGDTQCSANYTSPNTPPSTLLLTTVIFGFGTLSSPPSSTQPTLAQAPACQTDSQTTSQSAGNIANSACVVFNSRGIPVDNTLTATSNDALYVTDSNSVYGVTVLATGLIQTWRAGLVGQTWSNR
jgi:prepilin-type N-terminal cleavage/methylation domain-containing protein